MPIKEGERVYLRLEDGKIIFKVEKGKFSVLIWEISILTT